MRAVLAALVALFVLSVAPLSAAAPDRAAASLTWAPVLPAALDGSGQCADPDAPGGDWARYGNTPGNQRFQPLEDRIGPDNADDVEFAWSFRPADHGLRGGFSSTPIVFDGCIYVTTTTGSVAALNADTGELVWGTGDFDGDGIEWHANPISAAPAVTDEAVYIQVNKTGSPYVAALDRETGSPLWASVFEHGRPSSTVVAGPVLHDGLIFQGFSGFEFEDDARGGFAIIDASPECSESSATVCADPVPDGAGGRVLVHRYTIPDDDYAQGYRGAGIWCTAAVDVETDYAYACTSNPASHGQEHRYTISLLKIGLDPDREDFGRIVGAYKGLPDSYVEGLDRQPACESFPDLTPYYSATCVALDLDFGASPNLFRDDDGNLLVGALQKAGVYHAAYADNMQAAWKTTVGAPCIWCNASSPATDGDGIYVMASPVAYMVGLERDGGYRWVNPVLGAFHYQSTSVANGVAYTVNGLGTLTGVDTSTGLTVLARSIALATNTPMAEVNATGVAIARHTLYATAADQLVAYRLP